jgi:hypothetical protein
VDEAFERAIAGWVLRLIDQLLTPQAIGLVLLVVLGLVVCLAVLAGLAFLVLRRRPNVRRAVLRLRAENAEPGPRAEVLDMRLHIQDELADTQRIVASAAAASGLASELPELLARLEEAVSQLDGELRGLERDGWLSSRELRSMRARTARVAASARNLRSAAQDALAAARSGELDQLARDVDRKTQWVRDGVDALDDLDADGASRVAYGRGSRSSRPGGRRSS